MTRRVPPTNWLFGNLNIGGVLRIDGQGGIVDALWDRPDGALYMITSMREHKGALYLGGVTNNKIGAPGPGRCRHGLDGSRQLLGKSMNIFSRARKSEPPGMTLEGVLGPNGRLDDAAAMPAERLDALATTADGHLLFSSGQGVEVLDAWGEAPATLGPVRTTGHGAGNEPGRTGRDRPREWQDRGA